MAQLFKNFARARIASSIGSSDTTIVLQSGYGAIFPEANMGTGPTGDWFKCVLEKATGEREIVSVRTRSSGSDILSNVLRAQEGTTAISFDANTVIGLRPTAEDMTNAVSVPAVVVQKTGDTGSAVMPSGTSVQRDASPFAGYTRFNTTTGRNETWNGTEWVPDGWIELGTFVTTSGTSISFAGIPAYVNELALLLVGVSQTSTGNSRIRLHNLIQPLIVGYTGTRQYINMASATTGASPTDGFYLHAAAAGVALSGQVNLKRYGTTWYITGMVADAGPGGTSNVNGYIDLGSRLTQIDFDASVGAFDAGSISLIGRA